MNFSEASPFPLDLLLAQHPHVYLGVRPCPYVSETEDFCYDSCHYVVTVVTNQKMQIRTSRPGRPGVPAGPLNPGGPEASFIKQHTKQMYSVQIWL